MKAIKVERCRVLRAACVARGQLLMIGFVCTDHGTPPPAPAPAPPPPEFPPRGSSFNHPSLVALQNQPPARAATLVVTKDSDEPPTYEVIPYSTGRWRFTLSTRRRRVEVTDISDSATPELFCNQL